MENFQHFYARRQFTTNKLHFLPNGSLRIQKVNTNKCGSETSITMSSWGHSEKHCNNPNQLKILFYHLVQQSDSDPHLKKHDLVKF